MASTSNSVSGNTAMPPATGTPRRPPFEINMLKPSLTQTTSNSGTQPIDPLGPQASNTAALSQQPQANISTSNATQVSGPAATPISSQAPSTGQNQHTPVPGQNIDPTFDKLLPASYRRENTIYPSSIDLHGDFLDSQLTIPRLDRVQPLLWIVGRIMPCRPLYYQKVISREIYIHESMDMHLVWGKGRLFLKPIPRFLLDPQFWTKELQCDSRFPKPEPTSKDSSKKKSSKKGYLSKGPCPNSHSFNVSMNAELVIMEDDYCLNCRYWRCALGYLLSYTSLISHESDFLMAKSANLIPQEVEWHSWRAFVAELLKDEGEDLFTKINRRFIHGELRLSRLNKIYRIRHFQFLRGYVAGYNQYSDFFHDNFTALASGTIYVALVLTAMQVGLATTQLSTSPRFMAVSYGFTVFSILGPLIVTVIILIVFMAYFVLNVRHTLALKDERMKVLGLIKETTKSARGQV